MDNFSKKALEGQLVSAGEWLTYLREVHKNAPSMTPHAFSRFVDANSRNTYQLLAETLTNLSLRKRKILDLACGDGYLVPFIQNVVLKTVDIIGVDMSEQELEIARQRKLGPKVAFRNELADHISEESGSVDAVVCHMALMLMNPTEGVLSEVYRLLRAGGLFSSLIMVAPSEKSFNTLYRKILMDFIMERYPSFKPPVTGDPRVSSSTDVKTIFLNAKFEAPQIRDFTLISNVPPEETWGCFKDMYFVTLLPLDERKELGEKVIEEAKRMNSPDGTVSVELPVRIITSYKK